MELASIFAGENDMDIDRVRFFRDAMAASAPIVLDLSPDAGFDQFFAALSFIGEAVAKDSKLPKKLVSSVANIHQDSGYEAQSITCGCLMPFNVVSPGTSMWSGRTWVTPVLILE